jgi:hypothetical protein
MRLSEALRELSLFKIELFIVACIVAILYIAYESYDSSNDCERLGGRLVLSHYIPVRAGSINTMVPVYRCEHESE